MLLCFSTEEITGEPGDVMTSQATVATTAAPSGYEALLAIDPAVLEAIRAAV